MVSEIEYNKKKNRRIGGRKQWTEQQSPIIVLNTIGQRVKKISAYPWTSWKISVCIRHSLWVRWCPWSFLLGGNSPGTLLNSLYPGRGGGAIILHPVFMNIFQLLVLPDFVQWAACKSKERPSQEQKGSFTWGVANKTRGYLEAVGENVYT